MREIPSTYINGDPYSPDDVNSFSAELKAIISQLGTAFNSGSTVQIARAIQDIVGIGRFYSDTGSANTYTLGVTASRNTPTAYFTGMIVEFVAANANTGACTINVSSLGSKSLVDASGSALTGGEIVTTGITKAWYDGTDFRLAYSGSLKTSMGAYETTDISQSGGAGSALAEDTWYTSTVDGYVICTFVDTTNNASYLDVLIDEAGGTTASKTFQENAGGTGGPANEISFSLPIPAGYGWRLQYTSGGSLASSVIVFVPQQ